ncbi:BTB/POZ domain-containing protein [Glomus cerebriforme]|uniref:BTB/POZ domain-containing protein n=1 Tax=Glomus cerebriforme TaxID=658196 RepID=A0A397TGI1_9GLOM|nr:BTB/POZ domain-containing protein [Glomus cerebriforme]
MIKIHPIHYYDDGDIFLNAENTTFRLHKIILSLSSNYFKDSLRSINNQSKILKIELDGETPKSIERMLSLIYPNSFIKITWDNIEDFLRISDKFEINKIKEYCNMLLLQNFQNNLLLTIKLAEDYSLPDVYKESSKLILDEFQKYFSDSKFKLLSIKTQLKLYECWLNYHTKLQEFIYKYRKTQVYQNEKVVRLDKYINEKFPMTTSLKPSLLVDTFKSLSFKSLYSHFIYEKRIVINYEPLINNNNNYTDEWYIFIELKD